MTAHPGRVLAGPEPPGPLHRVAIVFLVTFLLVFPKGGIKFGAVPVTWGYLGLSAAVVPFLLLLATGRAGALARPRLAALAAMLPFQAILFGSLLAYGVDSLAWGIALLVAMLFLPAIFVLFLAPYLDRLDLTLLFRLIRWGVLAVAVYGIFLFVLKLTTGRFFEIPLLTVNQGDLGELEGKNIDRGGIFKLISTYSNGNLYGISLLTLLPLYAWLEPRWTRTAVVKGSLVLTLSRTVWIGLVLHEVLMRGYVRRLTVRTALLLGAVLAAVGGAVVYISEVLLGREVLRFLLDPTLGGRARQLQEVEVTLLPVRAFSGVSEILYASVLGEFGVLGLAAFLLAVATPLALHLLGCVPHARSDYKRSIAAGVATYLVIAMSDGALLLIPVMAFFWFMVSLLLSSNPSFASWPDGPAAHPDSRSTALVTAPGGTP